MSLDTRQQPADDRLTMTRPFCDDTLREFQSEKSFDQRAPTDPHRRLSADLLCRSGLDPERLGLLRRGTRPHIFLLAQLHRSKEDTQSTVPHSRQRKVQILGNPELG